MVKTYKCLICGKEFDRKSNLEAHLNRKKKCTPKIITETNNIEYLVNDNPVTFIQLGEYIEVHRNTIFKDEVSIISWFKNPWNGKNKLESILRFLLNIQTSLIDSLASYKMCIGSFNEGEIKISKNRRELFFRENGTELCLNDKGSFSDITLIDEENKKLLMISVKDKNKEHITDYDISKIYDIFDEHYKNNGMIACLGLCTRSKDNTLNIVKKSESTSQIYKDRIMNHSTVLLDYNDVAGGVLKFLSIFKNTSIKDILENEKNGIKLKLHQELGVYNTYDIINKGGNKILWGHIPRSGKSYIIAGTIIKDKCSKNICTYMIITTAPNETIEQYINVFNCYQLNDVVTHHLTSKTEKNLKSSIKSNKKNIIVVSKDYLIRGAKSKEIKKLIWLKNLDIDIVFFDESHRGGTTNLAQRMINYYCPTSVQIYITATYSKPANDYHIPKDNWIMWDLEDIRMCKNINTLYTDLYKKHPNIQNIIEENKYDNKYIIDEYKKYPKLEILTWDINKVVKSKIQMKTMDNDYGWSLKGVFLGNWNLKTLEENDDPIFQNPSKVLDVFYHIFGKYDEFEIPNNSYDNFMEQIRSYCTLHNSRHMNDEKNEPMIIMAFLPEMNIKEISDCTTKLLVSKLPSFNKDSGDYIIVNINTKERGNPKLRIEKARSIAKTKGKKGVLVLSGTQCHLGITIDNCDVVLLLNNTESYDRIYQMIYRCMTEGKNKKFGFVIDLNIGRMISKLFVEYGYKLNPDNHPTDTIKYILKGNLIGLNCNSWEKYKDKKLSAIATNIYNIYANNPDAAIKNILDRLNNNTIKLSTENQALLNNLFTEKSKSKSKKKEDDENELKNGITKSKVVKKKSTTEHNDNIEEIKNIKYINIIKHIIPLLCLLSINNDRSLFNEMFDFVRNNDKLYNIFKYQLNTWWKIDFNSDIIDVLISIYQENVTMEIKQNIRLIKELFIKNINNPYSLSKLIDIYFVPVDLEVKENAEVSSPYKLRQEMLDKLSEDFWKNKFNKVLEPCCGKGGFVLDIFERFMNGLAESIQDMEERKKYIINNCLYWCDINPTNTFIVKLLIDPKNIYKLNYYEGDTLQLNINEYWKIKEFNAVIGNPPYQAVTKEGVTKGGGNNLYTKFIYYADSILSHNGYILYINPPTYFSPGRSINKSNMNLRKDVINNYYCHYLNLEECSKHFNVGSKFIYYLIQKNNKINKNIPVICKYKNNIYNSEIDQQLLVNNRYLPYLLTNTSLTILSKIKNNMSKKLNIFNSTVFDKRRPHVLNKEKKESDENYNKRAIKTGYIYPIKATSVQIVYSSKKCKYQDNKKILMSESGYLKPFYDDGILGVGGHCFACLVDNITDGNNIIKLLDSNLYKFYIDTNKWSGFHNREVLKDLPNIINRLDEINNLNIYKFFKLTNEEIQFVETNI
uniref:C2H2-type domain-containing protein n=1 Tax=Megaviridae environmental sample TaxID=1737588 RepID=A0A5J6VKL2_9VIRU|nr:MAG: hypothetical protein [Megaviridae environmental sample]